MSSSPRVLCHTDRVRAGSSPAPPLGSHITATVQNAKSERKFSNNVSLRLRLLPQLDPGSEEFAKSFRSVLSSGDERTNILALSEEDTRLFIEIADRAIQTMRLEPELHTLAFSVLRRLCGRVGCLPGSYLLPNEFDLSGLPRVSGGFADVRMREFEGKNVAVKSVRVSEVDDKARIRKQFCEEVAMWKNMSHPNILDLIGVPDALEDGRLSMVSEWMSNGDITRYVRDNAGNHLKLLADALEGLEYLHDANIAHGDLKGANILITNANPVTACLADFGFTTIVDGPSLGMESAMSAGGGGTIKFMAPELLAPSRFGLDECAPSKEADIYAIAMTIYQVLTGTLPFGRLPMPEVVSKVLEGERPTKPANALELGLSDEVWKLLEDCWQPQRALRPSVKDVLDRVQRAVSVCGTLPPVGDVQQHYEDPESDSSKFDRLFLGTASPDDGEIGVYPADSCWSQGSTLTVASMPNSLFSKLSEAESSATEPWSSHSNGVLSDAFSHPLSDPPLTAHPISRSCAWSGSRTSATMYPTKPELEN